MESVMIALLHSAALPAPSNRTTPHDLVRCRLAIAAADSGDKRDDSVAKECGIGQTLSMLTATEQ
jgi:hypothetical protein